MAVRLATSSGQKAPPSSVAEYSPPSFLDPRSAQSDPMGLPDFKVDSSKIPVRIDYYGGGPVCGIARFLIHNPLKLTNPYPNDISPYCGVDMVLGLKQKRRSDTPFMGKVLDITGEIHFTFMYGKASDTMSPDDVAADEILREFTDQVEDGLNQELQDTAEQVEREIKNEVQEITGVRPNVDLNVDYIDLNPSSFNVDNLKVARDSTFYGFFLQWRTLVWPGLSVYDGRLNLMDVYFNIGAGGTHTRTQITVIDEKSTRSAQDWMARLGFDMDVFRYEGDKWMMALRGGGGMMLGQQGGPEASLGLAFFRKAGRQGL